MSSVWSIIHLVYTLHASIKWHSIVDIYTISFISVYGPSLKSRWIVLNRIDTSINWLPLDTTLLNAYLIYFCCSTDSYFHSESSFLGTNIDYWKKSTRISQLCHIFIYWLMTNFNGYSWNGRWNICPFFITEVYDTLTDVDLNLWLALHVYHNKFEIHSIYNFSWNNNNSLLFNEWINILSNWLPICAYFKVVHGYIFLW